MQRNDLIQHLVQDLRPVRSLVPVRRRFTIWLAVAVASMAAVMAWIGCRSDLSGRLSNIPFCLESALLAAAASLAAWNSLTLSIPGSEPRKSLLWYPVILAALWMASVLIHLAQAKLVSGPSVLHPGVRLSCVVGLLLLSAIPGSILFGMIHRGVSLHPALNGAFALFSPALLGACGMRWICDIDSPIHLLVWHLAPVLAAGALGIYVGRWLLQWEKRIS